VSWEDLQRDVREKPCIVLGHDWIGVEFERFDLKKHAAEERKALRYECLRCGEIHVPA
jgi:hypothetical protein